MKCPSYSDDSTVLCQMEKAETDLGEVKGHTVSPRKSPSSKGPHNKENNQKKRHSLDVASDDEVILSSGSLSEDSGYLSLQNSQVDNGDVDAVDSWKRKEETHVSSQLLNVECRSAPCLPVLKFQEEVCRELAKSFKRSKSYDWTVVDKVAENHGLHNVIGGKMGRPFVGVPSTYLPVEERHEAYPFQDTGPVGRL